MYLHTFDVTVADNRIYFAATGFNALFAIDLRKKEIIYKKPFEGYAKYTRELFSKQILHDGKIIFIPRYYDKVAIYDLQTEKTIYIEMPNNGEGVIRDAFIAGNDLWMLREGYPSDIYQIDLATGKYSIFHIDWKEITARTGYSGVAISNQEKKSTIGYAKQVGEKWWMFAEKHGNVIAYDWKKGRSRAINFPYFVNKQFTGNVREKLWLIARDESRILEYDFYNERDNWVEIPALNEIQGDIMRIIEYGQYLLIIKQMGMVVADKKTFSAEPFWFSEKKNLMSYAVWNNKLILFPIMGKGLIVFSLEDHSIQEYPFVWEETLTKETLREVFSGCLCEDVCRLPELLELLPYDVAVRSYDVGAGVWNDLSGSEVLL